MIFFKKRFKPWPQPECFFLRGWEKLFYGPEGLFMFMDEPLVSHFIDAAPMPLHSTPSQSQISKLPVQPGISPEKNKSLCTSKNLNNNKQYSLSCAWSNILFIITQN